jgi:sugar phosphate isomerase/epimerase
MSGQYENKIGLGMFTVHKSVEEDMKGTFMKLSRLGYKAIEFYGEPEFDVKLIQASLEASGLALTSWHVEWRNLQDDRFGRTAEYLNHVGCPIAVVPCFGGKWNIGHTAVEESRDVWLRYIEWLNKTNERLKKEGIRTGYHNHEHEFKLIYDGVSVFDLLFDGLSRDIVVEFDSGNCLEGGDDPLRVLKKYGERDVILHLKPYSKEKGFDAVLGDSDDLNNWKEILNPALCSFKWLLVESECAILPEFVNAERCFNGLKKYI